MGKLPVLLLLVGALTACSVKRTVVDIVGSAISGDGGRRYAASTWRFDRNNDDMPAHYAGTPKECLWRAFKSSAPMPIGERQLRNILAH